MKTGTQKMRVNKKKGLNRSISDASWGELMKED
jgi:transposase